MADALPFELILQLPQSHRLVLLLLSLLVCHISMPLHDETFALVSIVMVIRGSSSDATLLTAILASSALERRLGTRWGHTPSHYL